MSSSKRYGSPTPPPIHIVKLEIEEWTGEYPDTEMGSTTYTTCGKKITDGFLYNSMDSRRICKTCIRILVESVKKGEDWTNYFHSELKRRRGPNDEVWFLGKRRERADATTRGGLTPIPPLHVARRRPRRPIQ